MYYFKANGNDNIVPDCLLNYHGVAKYPTRDGLKECATVSHYCSKKKFRMPMSAGTVVQIPKSRTFVSFGCRFEFEKQKGV